MFFFLLSFLPRSNVNLAAIIIITTNSQLIAHIVVAKYQFSSLIVVRLGLGASALFTVMSRKLDFTGKYEAFNLHVGAFYRTVSASHEYAICYLLLWDPQGL